MKIPLSAMDRFLNRATPSLPTIQAYNKKQREEQAKLESANAAKNTLTKRAREPAMGQTPPSKLNTYDTTPDSSQPAKKKLKTEAGTGKREAAPKKKTFEPVKTTEESLFVSPDHARDSRPEAPAATTNDTREGERTVDSPTPAQETGSIRRKVLDQRRQVHDTKNRKAMEAFSDSSSEGDQMPGLAQQSRELIQTDGTGDHMRMRIHHANDLTVPRQGVAGAIPPDDSPDMSHAQAELPNNPAAVMQEESSAHVRRISKSDELRLIMHQVAESVEGGAANGPETLDAKPASNTSNTSTHSSQTDAHNDRSILQARLDDVLEDISQADVDMLNARAIMGAAIKRKNKLEAKKVQIASEMRALRGIEVSVMWRLCGKCVAGSGRELDQDAVVIQKALDS
jgi:hypothetical protein